MYSREQYAAQCLGRLPRTDLLPTKPDLDGNVIVHFSEATCRAARAIMESSTMKALGRSAAVCQWVLVSLGHR
eukprot:scaffold210260_cov46-Prasinocladus_malaysianus.AAC.1